MCVRVLFSRSMYISEPHADRDIHTFTTRTFEKMTNYINVPMPIRSARFDVCDVHKCVEKSRRSRTKRLTSYGFYREN